MKFEFISNACGIFHTQGGLKILCDPWIEDGVFDGSWCHCPPLKTQLKDLLDVDALYISHIHQDHYDNRNFNYRKDIPIIVLDHGPNFLIKNLERAGYTNLIRIKNDQTLLYEGVEITLYAPFAKNSFHDAKIGNLIDSAFIIKDHDCIAFNANDNTPTLAACTMLREKFGQFDMAMINYNTAGPYPSCFNNHTESEKQKEHDRLLQRNYDFMVELVNALKPKVVLPFAGAYVLGGQLHYKNPYLGTASWDDCADNIRDKIDDDSRVICLRENDCFDFITATSDKEYIPLDENEMKDYIENTLAKRLYPYEYDDQPDHSQLLQDCQQASQAMLQRMGRFKLELKTAMFLEVGDELLQIYKPEPEPTVSLRCSLDLRLLRRILDRKSHWNNAEIGAHIEFVREPNTYEPDVHTALQFFHL